MLDLNKLGYEAADHFDESEVKAYVEWLRETLIPDLHESGTHETAKDFETLVSLVERGVERGAYGDRSG